MNIAVYLGANEGNDPIYKEAALCLGRWLGEREHRLIYGGSKTGLMGILAKQVLDSGGAVTGVEPEFFMAKDFQMEGLTELIVTKDMQERRQKMMSLADVFIAFPGGTGTAEEISEVISAGSLGLLAGVYGYFNVNGFYDFAKTGYDRMVQQGFMTQENRDKIRFWRSIAEIERDLPFDEV